MTTREERLALNETASRAINEDLEGAHDDDPADRTIRILCECALEDCDRVIAIRPSEYEHVRSDGRWFAVMREHVVEDIEQVVEEADRFVMVQKRAGTPARTAIEEDPRG